MKDNTTRELVGRIRSGGDFTPREEISLILRLAIPAVFAQIANILMSCIDAAMVGSLGAEGPAAVGLVASSGWLLFGLGSAFITGYPVLAAHRIGAKDYGEARSLLRQGLSVAVMTGSALALPGVLARGAVPGLLGATPEIAPIASSYFAICTAGIPVLFASFLAGSMLRSTGNIKTPALLNMLMCVEDVLFNALLIFPTRTVEVLGVSFTAPGAGLGVTGAALGTFFAGMLTAALMLYTVCAKCPELALRGRPGRFLPELSLFKRALKIGVPLGCQHIAMCVAQIALTLIVAPLGTVAIAANSLALTAEGICYMPGFGISGAASSLTGQCIGAGRKDLAKRLARIAITLAMALMGAMGVILFLAAPLIMGILTPVSEIASLGASVLRIQAFAEPLFAAAIVTGSVFSGAGYTLVPCLMNLGCMWAGRLPAAYFLSHLMGLKGVWIAMCGEIVFRGSLFLVHFAGGRWMKKKA